MTVGTTTPNQSYLVPAGASSTVVGAMDKDFPGEGLNFNTGAVYACTTTPTGSTDPTTGLVLNVIYN